MNSILFGTLFILFMIFIIYPVSINRYQYIETFDGTYNDLNMETEAQLTSRIQKEEAGDDEVSNNYDVEYQLNNYDVEYHESAEDLEESYGYGLGYKTVFVYDPNGTYTSSETDSNFILLEVAENQTYPLYNGPNYYKYGNQSYVPSYADQIALSSQTNPASEDTRNTEVDFEGYIYQLPMATFTT